MNVLAGTVRSPLSLALFLEAVGAVALERCGAILDGRISEEYAGPSPETFLLVKGKKRAARPGWARAFGSGPEARSRHPRLYLMLPGARNALARRRQVLAGGLSTLANGLFMLTGGLCTLAAGFLALAGDFFMLAAARIALPGGR